MQTEQTPTLKQLAKRIERLYREKDGYLKEAYAAATLMDNERNGGRVNRQTFRAATEHYQDVASWLANLQTEINEAEANLANSIDALKW